MAKKKIVKEKTTKKKVEKEEVKTLTKKQRSKQENRILRNFLIIIGAIFLTILIFLISSYFDANFKYEGVKFKMVKDGELIFYQTSLPVLYQGEEQRYNFYLRNDPRTLAENVPVEGNMVFKSTMVLNLTNDLICEGDELIAVANFVNLHTVSGMNVVKDETASCDENGAYMYVQIRESNQTRIERFGPSCYYININDCEILEGTERFMVETFLRLNQLF